MGKESKPDLVRGDAIELLSILRFNRNQEVTWIKEKMDEFIRKSEAKKTGKKPESLRPVREESLRALIEKIRKDNLDIKNELSKLNETKERRMDTEEEDVTDSDNTDDV